MYTREELIIKGIHAESISNFKCSCGGILIGQKAYN
jgi:hypothetical protein